MTRLQQTGGWIAGPVKEIRQPGLADSHFSRSLLYTVLQSKRLTIQ
jgi:hypothetical protein